MVFGLLMVVIGNLSLVLNFNSPWELDGVRTKTMSIARKFKVQQFQFPLGIRWCSDPVQEPAEDNFPGDFQFPVGIRWCSDMKRNPKPNPKKYTFNSLWELDGVRTSTQRSLRSSRGCTTFNSLWELDGVRTCKTASVRDSERSEGLSIPCGN